MITREFLREVEIFRGLSDEQADKLLKLAREEVFRKGDVVFRERDPGTKIYIVLAGVVEICKTGRGGDAKSLRLTRLERGEIFGELLLFDDAPRSATAQAAVSPETRVAAWEIPALRALFDQDAALSNRVLRAIVGKLSQRLRATSDAVMTLLRTLDYTSA